MKKKILSTSAIITTLLLFHDIPTESISAKKEVKVYYASKNSNQLIAEPVDRLVKIVYHDNPLSRLFLPVSGYMGKYATQYAGKVANSTNQATVKAKIDHFQTLYKDLLNMHEYSVPEDGFNTFNDWFIRSFKDLEKSRPMSNDSLSIVSPADSKLLIIPHLSDNVQMIIKEQHFNVAKFLGDVTLAEQFKDGVMMIFRLAPYDYHHYHYPFDCQVGPEHPIKGGYHSVNPRAFTAGVKPLTHNKRSYELLKPVNSHQEKPIVMAQVGATAIASIVNEFMDYKNNKLKQEKNCIYKKGAAMGYFQFGGSTVVLLFPKDTITLDAQIIKNSKNGYETAVKVRETIATWKMHA